MSKKMEIVGQKFGRLTVLEFWDIRIRTGDKKESRWLCKCECGNEAIVVGSSLRSGGTSSCGCLKKEIIKKTFTTHGMSADPLYYVWKNMLERCSNEDLKFFKHYGGRGISVCAEWKDMNKFIDWANRNGYKKGLEIDRIDNDGNYIPNNCRFTTRKEQLLNTRRNIKVMINGVTKSVSEWAEEYDIKVNTLQYRYHRGDRGERLVRPIETQFRTNKVKEKLKELI